MEEKNSIVKVGNYLKKLREKKAIDLDFISNKSKISTKVLNKLEINQLSELPSKTYVQGFVKSYCIILKEDPAHALSLLDQDYKLLGTNDEPDKVHSTINSKIDSNSKNLSFSEKSLKGNKKLLSFLLFLIPILGILYFVFSSNSKEVTDSLQTTSTLAPKEQTSSTIASNQEPTKAQIAVSTSSTTTLAVKTTTTSTSIPKIITTTNVVEDLPFKLFKNIGKPSYFLGVKSTEFIPRRYRHRADGFNTVYINADGGSSWIRYKVDDEKIVTRTLRNGANVYLKGNSFYITTGNYNAISIYFNNRFVESPSTRDFRRLVFPISEYTEHKRPLFVTHKKKVYFYSDYMMLMNSP